MSHQLPVGAQSNLRRVLLSGFDKGPRRLILRRLFNLEGVTLLDTLQEMIPDHALDRLPVIGAYVVPRLQTNLCRIASQNHEQHQKLADTEPRHSVP